jgi:hypothetical protein
LGVMDVHMSYNTIDNTADEARGFISPGGSVRSSEQRVVMRLDIVVCGEHARVKTTGITWFQVRGQWSFSTLARRANIILMQLDAIWVRLGVHNDIPIRQFR